MEDADEEINSRGSSFAPPPWISISPFPPQVSPSPRRLSSSFTPPTRPVRAAKHLAWVSLQRRIGGTEEASIGGGGLNSEEAAAWELFSPMHRVLIVAVIAVAAANSKKNKQIMQLEKSVKIRDQVLSGIQQKLENICKQMNCSKDPPDISSYSFKFSGCGCRLCGNHQLPSESKEANYTVKAVDDEAMTKCKIVLENDTEPEERRMSDLSDWAPSVSSTEDGQWNTTSIEQDLRKELEDKDAMINELSSVLNAPESLGSKRISELEDIIRRKNLILTKLRKDMLALEQKVIHLTRLRRTSNSNLSSRKLPTMTDNLVYDMDSTTSPSSSDSDSTNKKDKVSMLKNEDQVLSMKMNSDQSNTRSSRRKQKTKKANSADHMVKSTKRPPKPVSPLKERSMNQQIHSLSVSRDFNRRNHTTKSSVSTSNKRWL